MNDNQKLDILTSLDNMSNQVGEIITEYHWRELQSIRLYLKKEWKIEETFINDHTNIMTVKDNGSEY